ncbi:MAG TPA: hypothetical protein VFZ65_13260 [Planctomycetota bacterium]|nr:hypothetical protein [Planctomycetota bacterium]
MDHQGHGLALDHTIFHTPNEVHFPVTETPREKQYEAARSVLYPEGMGETFGLVQFEHDKAADDWNPIIVNHEGFFTDVPGFESLAEGHSAKCLGSLSLARQGRWFYWGYSTDPQRLTDPAKDTLVNVLYYMRGKRDSITVPFVCVTRQIFQVYLDLNKESGYLRGIEEHMPNQLTPEWQKTYTDRTPKGYAQWLDTYLPYVFSGKGPQHLSKRYKQVYEVDADAMALQTPNRERKSLERWLELAVAGSGEDEARAQRCLSRYVHPSIAPKDGDWHAWYEAQRDRIVFIESTGFWWQEDPRVLERERDGEVVR